jgi:4-amino-4-deoxy-L-arabinose transferase-like glycosyltransferase
MRLKQPFLIALLAIVVLIPTMPLLAPMPNRDSGVFLYIGERILHGDILYHQVWDHKSPLVYFINALGLAISGGSRWGIWILELAAIATSIYLGWITFKQVFGVIPSIVATVIWTSSLAVVLDGGNVTEEWALPLQFLALYLYARCQNTQSSRWHMLLLGGVVGGTFLLKPNLIGLSAVIIGLILVKHIQARLWRVLGRDILLVSLGVSAAVLPWLIYFARYQALAQLFDAVITYNIAYSATPFAGHIVAGVQGILRLALSGISPLAQIGWVIGWLSLRNAAIPPTQSALVRLALIAFPTEVLLNSISGRTYAHYYLTWLPVSALLVAILVATLLKIPVWRAPILRWYRLILVLLAVPSTGIAGYYITRNLAFATSYNRTVSYIRDTTEATDFVHVWGVETRINFASQRQSPTRFSYQTPLYNPRYNTAKAIRLFMEDLAQHQPSLIVDASPESYGFPSLQSAAPATNPAADAEIQQFYAYVAANYTKVAEIEPDHWSIYRIRTPTRPD